MMRQTRCRLLAVGCAAALLVSGCAGRGKQAAPKTAPVAARQPLPNWAPAHPSPEFLRAAKVIKPLPEEPGHGGEDLAQRAASERYARTIPAGWEVFGTLSDAQIAHLLKTKEIHIAFRDLTDKQRTALLHYLDVCRKAFEGFTPPETEGSGDPLVDLYKLGAKQDLSNVDVSFWIRTGSKRLVLDLRPKLPDGTLGLHCPFGLGMVYTAGSSE